NVLMSRPSGSNCATFSNPVVADTTPTTTVMYDPSRPESTAAQNPRLCRGPLRLISAACGRRRLVLKRNLSCQTCLHERVERGVKGSGWSLVGRQGPVHGKRLARFPRGRLRLR